MADPSKILIVFDVEDKSIVTATDRLKTTNSVLLETAKAAQLVQKTVGNSNRANAVAFSDLTKRVSDTSKALKQMIPNLDQLDDKMRGVVESMVEGLAEGFVRTLAEAKDELKDFGDEATKTKSKTSELAKELKASETALLNMVHAGQEGTQEFADLQDKVAGLKAQISDTKKSVSELSESGLGFRAISEGIGLMSGAFGVATGAQALFGKESEALNETLTRLNAITAINTSLEQINNALKKEGALSTAILSIETKLLNAQKAVDNALTSESVVVRGAATAAQWALNVAMAANPIGIVITAVVALIAALSWFAIEATKAKDAQAELNQALEQGDENFRLNLRALEQTNQIQQAAAQNKKASESEITAIARKGIEDRLALTVAERERNQKELEKLNASVISGTEEGGKIRTELQKRIGKALDSEEDLRGQLIINRLNEQTQAAKEAEEKKKKAKDDAEKAEKERIEREKARYDELIAAQQRIVIATKEGSKANVEAQAKVIDLTAKKTLATEKLLKNQRLLIAEQAEKDILDMKKKYLLLATVQAIDAEIALQEARLTDPALDIEGQFAIEQSIRQLNYDKERAQAIAAKQSTQAIDERFRNEREAAEGKFAQKLFDQEQAIAAQEDFAHQDALQRIIGNEKEKVDVRINAMKAVLLGQLETIRQEENFAREQYQNKKISLEQLEKAERDAQNKRLKLNKDFEEKVTLTQQEEAEKRLRAQLDMAAQVVGYAGQVFETLNEFARNQTERELQAIDYRRERLEGLRETGAITEKEYLRNLKVIDAEEKRIQNEAARREKTAAIFKAVIDTAGAVIKALGTGPIVPNFVAGAIMAAFGAAQIALIASKPVPKFRTGTKNSPEGLAMVGEGGTELITHGGRMYLSPPKPSMVWLKKGSTVLTAGQTRAALKGLPGVSLGALDNSGAYSINAGINTKELAKAIGENLQQINVNIDKDGFGISQQKGHAFTNYLNDRFKL